MLVGESQPETNVNHLILVLRRVYNFIVHSFFCAPQGTQLFPVGIQ